MRFHMTLIGLAGSLLLAPSFTAEAAPTSPAPAPAPSVPPAAPVAPAAPAAKAPAAPAAMDGQTYAVQLRDLSERIDDLKEKIRHHRTKIAILGDRILDGTGVGAGAWASIKLSSELSRIYRVTRVLVALDRSPLISRVDPTGPAAEPFEIPVFDGPIPPGDHTLEVVVNLQGEGFGVFSYMRGYHFEVRSSHSFTAVEGKTIKLNVVGYETGTSITPFEERPALRYGEKIVDAPAPSATPAPSR